MAPKTAKVDAQPEVFWSKAHSLERFNDNRVKFPPAIKLDKGASRHFLEVYQQCLTAMQMVALPCFQCSLKLMKPCEKVSIHSHDIDSASATVIGYALSEATDVKAISFMDVVIDSQDIFSFAKSNANIVSLSFERMPITLTLLNMLLDTLRYTPFVRKLSFRRCSFPELSVLKLLCQYFSTPDSYAITHLTIADCGLGALEQGRGLDALVESFSIDKRVTLLNATEATRFLINKNYGVRFLNLEGNGMDIQQTRALLGALFERYVVESPEIQIAFIKRELYYSLVSAIFSQNTPDFISDIKRVAQILPSFESATDALVSKLLEIIAVGKTICYPSTNMNSTGSGQGGTSVTKPKGKDETPSTLVIDDNAKRFLSELYVTEKFSALTDEEIHIIAVALPPKHLQSITFEYHPTIEYAVPNSSLLSMNLKANKIKTDTPEDKEDLIKLLEHTSLCYLAIDTNEKEKDGSFLSEILSANRKRMEAIESPYTYESVSNVSKKK